ncbi:MAG: FtsX-like permease family protein [Phycisphaerales bacterium]|nr:ABC transporter permease [Planctomycetota bacterium]MCH8509172.1 FtsX-like permease family protein [Phycisphaerales bacterium]
MYQALLTRKYLTSKVMPLLAMAAVTLSVATILITWSVMGGFLNALMTSGRAMIGDAYVVWPNVGFAHYDDLAERLEAHPDIHAAAPIIETYGMVKLPDDRVELIQIKGVQADSYHQVTGFSDTLWWKPLDRPTRKDREGRDIRLDPDNRPALERFAEHGRRMVRPDPDTGIEQPAGLLGIEVTGMNQRTTTGIYVPMNPSRRTADGGYDFLDEFMPRNGAVGVTVLSLDSTGRPTDPVSRTIPIANEFQTGIYEVDSGTLIAPLDLVQRMLRMNEARRIDPEAARRAPDPFDYDIDPDTGELRPFVPAATRPDPARVTTVLIRGRPGMRPERVAEIAAEIYVDFARDHRGEVPDAHSIHINTWEARNRTMIEAVKKETGLVLAVFGVICFTTVFLVLAIFWSMISEKTKDIGILRALGASTPGVAWLWLRYGASIGIVGATLGLVAGYLIVTNINAIHDWLGARFGLLIWDPRVYYFVEIPREVELPKAVIVFVVGVLTCVLGALIPAVRSARMDPVKALRFE